MSKRRGKFLFMNKKKQKMSVIWAVLVAMLRAKNSKTFLRRFFLKADPFPFPLKSIML